MKVLLVWPKFDSFSFWHFEKVCELTGTKYMTPPLGLLTVAALMPQDWEFKVIDENVEELTDAHIEWAELMVVSSKIVHRGRAIQVIKRGRAAGIPVAAGGPDPMMNPERYSDADFLCLGEGEVTVPMLLEGLKNGVKSAVYHADRLPEMSESPVPRFDLIDFSNYLYFGLQYSRGCPHHCEFCNVIDLFSNKYRHKSVDQVIHELQCLYDTGYRGQVDFFDDNLVGKINDAKKLLRAIAGWLKEHNYPFHMSTSVTINIAQDEELLGLFREARFKYFLVGIETPDENSLKHAQKPQNVGFSIAEAAERIYRLAGATIHSGFLLGLDGEPDNIADKIIDCIDEACVPWVMAGMVYPLPGTQLSKRLDREKRLFPKARHDLPEGTRDQISAGLQFRPERPAKDVIRDLIRVMHHSFDPEDYFKRCSDVAIRLNTIPNFMPSWPVFYRNLRTVARLSVTMTKLKDTRRHFWKNFGRVLVRNHVGIEAFATLSVLYVHFESMMPYAYEQLDQQLRRVEADEAGWLAENLKEPEVAEEPSRAAYGPVRFPIVA